MTTTTTMMMTAWLLLLDFFLLPPLSSGRMEGAEVTVGLADVGAGIGNGDGADEVGKAAVGIGVVGIDVGVDVGVVEGAGVIVGKNVGAVGTDVGVAVWKNHVVFPVSGVTTRTRSTPKYAAQ